MRTAFVRALMKAACENPRILLLTGDLGFAVLDEFRANCPRQFYNVGVAEQNLAGVAAGLALSGHIVFTYSIGNFPTLRCLEQHFGHGAAQAAQRRVLLARDHHAEARRQGTDRVAV